MFSMLWISKVFFLLFPKNPSLHHPRAMFLGLTNEKIVLLSANSIRATVATENNKVWAECLLLNLTSCFFHLLAVCSREVNPSALVEGKVSSGEVKFSSVESISLVHSALLKTESSWCFVKM